MSVAQDKMAMGAKAVRIARFQPFPDFSKEFLKIRTKIGSVIPFELNEPQMIVHRDAERQIQEHGKVRTLVLKARQEGISTYIQGRFYRNTSGQRGKQAFILTHEDRATNNLFGMTKRFHDNMDNRFKPFTKKSNAKELVFSKLDSAYAVGTAKTGSGGRSFTIQYFHGSEVAFWGDAEGIATGVMQGVADAPGTEIWLESTAKGMSNYFYRLCARARKGLNEFKFMFLPWFLMQEYQSVPRSDLDLTIEEEEYARIWELTLSQMQWRHDKIEQFGGGDSGLIRFQQEYPATPEEAFSRDETNALIKSVDVLKARKAKGVEAIGNRIWGVDPAWLGKDRFRIWERQGCVAKRVGGWEKLDTVQSTGRLLAMLNNTPVNDRPKRIFIDVIGIGAGVYDQMNHSEFGDLVTPVNAGSSPDEPLKYFNKRAEMWGRTNEWLSEQPQVSLPDEDEIQADLTCTQSKKDSKYRVKLESKDDIRDRGEPSPDDGDALTLTFAYLGYATDRNDTPDPNRPLNWRTM